MKREEELDERCANQHRQTQKLLETLSKRVSETERKIQVSDYSPGGYLIPGQETVSPYWTAFGRPATTQQERKTQDTETL